MLRTPLPTRISIDHIHCHKEGDAIGVAEPYLWTVFFKVDGETAVVGTDFFLKGECRILATDGSHGNLGDRSVDGGDKLAVPPTIGEFRTVLRPIPRTDRPDADAPAFIGAVTVLMEEDNVTDHGARAGYAALADFVKKAVNEKIPHITLNTEGLGDQEIRDLFAKASKAIAAAVRSVQTDGEDVWAWVDKDDTVGFKFVTFTQDDLADNYWDITARFQERTTDGVVIEDWQLLGESQGARPSPHNYTHARRSQDVGSPRAASAPAITLRPSSGVQSIVYRDTQGRLHELSRDAIGQIGTRDLTGEASAPKAEGAPFAYVETTTGVEIVFYRAGNGHVYDLYWSDGAARLDDVSGTAGSPPAAGNLVTTFNEATNTHHVVYRGRNGHLHVLYWTGASDPVHYGGQLTNGTDSPRPAGDPTAYFNNEGTNIVAYRGTDAHVHSLYWSTGGTLHDDLSGVAGTPGAVGDPVACYVSGADLNHITYRAADKHLYELSWRGADVVVGRDLMAASGAPEAESDPAVFYSAATNTVHVVYRGPSGHLFEIWWAVGGTPAFVDLTLAALAPRAVDRPAALTMDAANTRYVVYRGTDNQIHEISWIANP